MPFFVFLLGLIPVHALDLHSENRVPVGLLHRGGLPGVVGVGLLVHLNQSGVVHVVLLVDVFVDLQKGSNDSQGDRLARKVEIEF